VLQPTPPHAEWPNGGSLQTLGFAAAFALCGESLAGRLDGLILPPTVLFVSTRQNMIAKPGMWVKWGVHN